MKKILFIVPSFMHGGTNKSLTNILSLIKNENAEFYLYCIKKHSVGVYKEIYESFNNITVFKEDFLLSSIYNIKDDNEKRIIKFVRMFCIFLSRILGKSFIKYSLKRAAMRINNKFDVIVSMQEGIATEFASYILSKRKIAWVRCEYSRYISLAKVNEAKLYDKFDKIICVSEAAKDNFLNVLPQYHSKTICIRNVQNSNEIIRLSSENIHVKLDESTFNIVSVGRFDIVKQFSFIPEILDKLKKRNKKIKWYIIGDGTERSKIEQEIKKYNLENDIILLGYLKNPYPIIKQADLVAITSSSESFCNVIEEGQILNVPVITTPFAASKELIEDGYNGYICNLGNFSDRITTILNNKHDYNKIKDNLKELNYTEKNSIDLIEKVIFN